MIETIFRGSVFGRLAAYFQKIYHLGAIAAFFRALRLAYAHSALRRVVRALMDVPSAAKNSVYVRCLTALNRVLHRVGTRLEHVWKNSRLYRLLRAVGQSKTVLCSGICKFFVRIGYRKLGILLFSIYFPVDWVLRSVESLSLLASYWDEAFLAVCLLLLVAERIAAREQIAARPTAADAPLWFFIAVSVFLCLVISPDMGIAVAGLRAVVQYMLWFFVLTRFLRDEGDWLWFVLPLCAIGVLVSLHGVYQFVVGAPIPAAWVSQSEMGVRTRVYSIFGSPNIMGAFLVMTAPLCAAFAYMVRGWGAKVLAWGAAGLLCIACLVTFSRGAWLGLAVAILLFALLVDRRLLLFAFLACGVAVFIPEVSGRITFLFTDDFAQRTMQGGRGERWTIGMQLLRSVNSFFGFGLGRFGGAVAMQNQILERTKYFYMDNYYLKTLVEMGYFGLVSYLFLLLSTLWGGLRKIFSLNKTKTQVIAAALFAGMAGILTHCYFENIFEVPYMNAYFWGMAAVLLTLHSSKRKA